MALKGITREQKWSVVILSFGTFLEYFDLMLYVHMSVLLNDMFFPQIDPTTKQLLTATTFCLTFLIRPIGGIIIGKIGDKFGRKSTITITTFVMATACLIMAFTPEYKDIGITATVMVIVARILQGFSSLGEVMGVELYLAETLKIPYRCMASSMIGIAAELGSLFALATTSIALSMGSNWRYAFVFGAFIAVIGVFARLRLRETPEFVDYKKRIIKKVKTNNQSPEDIKNIQFNDKKVDKKAVLAFAFTECHLPICFFITYMYLGDLMKKSLNMTVEQVSIHNLKITIFSIAWISLIVYLVKKVHPLKIAIISALFFSVVLPLTPY